MFQKLFNPDNNRNQDNNLKIFNFFFDIFKIFSTSFEFQRMNSVMWVYLGSVKCYKASVQKQKRHIGWLFCFSGGFKRALINVPPQGVIL